MEKIKSNRMYYAIFKDNFSKAHNITENFVENIFVPIEKIDEKIRVQK